MITTARFLPLVSFIIFVIVKISACTGFSSSSTQSTTQTTQHQHYNAHVLQRWPRRHNSIPSITCRWKKVEGHDHHVPSTTSLTMGLFDYLQERFLDSREEGDFIPLEQSDDDTFGPGPLVLMYAVPASVDDNELKDMVEDGMPQRANVVIRRLSGMNENGEGGDELLDVTVGEALNKAMTTSSSGGGGDHGGGGGGGIITITSATSPLVSSSSPEEEPCPVLYFSGVSNSEMMDTYNIIANEIYEETKGVHWPACAKVVPPAMGKSTRRVLTEISGDHADAMRMRREEAETTKDI